MDVGGGERDAQLVDVVPGRSAASVIGWLDDEPDAWRETIRYGVLELSGPYRKVFHDALEHVTQVADPFQIIKLANSKLDECRLRVQNETLGHRGRKHDPLYRARRLFTKAYDRRGAKLRDLLAAGDSRGEVRTAGHAKETVRGLYDVAEPDTARAFVAQLGIDLQDHDWPSKPNPSVAPSGAGSTTSSPGTEPE